VKAEFPRPPATSATPIVETSSTPESPEEPPVEPEESPEPAPEPTPVEAEPPPSETPPRRPPPPEPAPTEELPAVPPSPQIASNQEIDPEVAAKLERADALVSTIDGRELSREQREQVVAARAFMLQARKALDEGDERRALVLIDKGLILAEDVERSSRE